MTADPAFIDSIQNRPQSSDGARRPRVTLLLGGLDSGKTLLTELITGATGLAGNTLVSGESPVNSAAHTVTVLINGDEHFIDTPGKSIKDIRRYVTFVGVWFVVDNTTLRQRPCATKALRWLAAFCARSFYSRLTFVTTFWEATDVGELRGHKTRFEARCDQYWSEFIEFIHHGARTHRFGVNTSMVLNQAKHSPSAMTESSWAPKPDGL
ncbi:hypothetical protein ETB97_008548 [Aspergillus alliaceus]|uniref:G domain-containing protein n=1 Tax=Petromyces alliaceus TaxID=209559 RepID=A0A8H6A998_PETAA|nr:hypothetical protein ETB97_008548 [Aspergillus burnettii]